VLLLVMWTYAAPGVTVISAGSGSRE